jgi:hypothetical protein
VKDCSEKSQNYCSTGDRTAELNIHLEDPVSSKTVRRELHKSNIHGRAAIAEPLITESNAQMRKRCHDIKTWTSDKWKHARGVVRWVVLHAVPYIRKRIRLENTQGSLHWFQSVSNIVVQYSVGPIFALHGRITAREYVNRVGNQVHHLIQTLYPNSDAVFQDYNARILTRFEHHWTILVSFGDYSEEQIPTSNISEVTWRCSSRSMV